MSKKMSILVLWVLLLAFAPFDSSQAQIESVEIRVDGLACPFCSYGLEKKLKKIEGVGEVKIYVDKGLAAIQFTQDQSILIDKLEPTVREAGFTPGEIKATVVGKIAQEDGTLVFSVARSDVIFMLKENDELKKLRSELQSTERLVRVFGRLIRETPKGHHAHPYTLEIEKFELI